jgi:hypothetical protein
VVVLLPLQYGGGEAFISIVSQNKGLAGIQYDIIGSNLKGCISSAIKSANTSMCFTNKKTISVGIITPDDIDDDATLTVVSLTLPPAENLQLPQLRIISMSLNEGNIPAQIQDLMVTSTAPNSQYSMRPSVFFNYKTIAISNIHFDGESQLWSLNGKLVYKNSFAVNNNHSTFIKLNALRKGIYLYRLNSGSFTDKGSFILNK